MSRWPMVKLGDVLEPAQRPDVVDATREYRLLGVRLESRGPFLREIKSGAETSAKTLCRVRAGDFIYSRLFAWRGAFGVIPPQLDECYVSSEFPVFVSRDGGVDLHYLSYWFRLPAVLERIAADCTGSTPLTRNRYKEHFFLRLEIPLPPIEEQRRVVEKLNRLATARAASEQVRTRIARDLQVVLRKGSRLAFSTCRDAHELCIDDVCTDIIDCLHSNPVYSDTGVPTLRSPDVGWGELLLATARTTSDDEYVRRTQRGEPQPGDIVLVREGGGTGKAGIVGQGQKLSLGQRVMLLRPDRERILPRFLLHQWLSSLVQDDQIAPRMKGSAAPHLNIGALKQFRIACPTLVEQQVVVDRVECLRRRVDGSDALLGEARSLTDALLPAAMSRFWG